MIKKVMKPTSGKWSWYWKEVDGETECGVVSDKGYSVCRAPRYQTREQWEVDAPILAAAPELLHALIGCVEHMEHSTPQGAAAYDAARAAIAKATGEQP